MSFAQPGDDKRCDHCDRPGEPYEYRGQRFSGLCSYEGEKLCPGCRDRQVEGQAQAPVGWANVPASHYLTPRGRL